MVAYDGPCFEVIIYDGITCIFKFIKPIVTQKNTISNFQQYFFTFSPKKIVAACISFVFVTRFVLVIFDLGEKKDKNTEFKLERNNNNINTIQAFVSATIDQRCPPLNRALSLALDI